MFYLSKDGEQSGPFLESQMRTMWDGGHITADTMCWQEGWSDWRLVADFLHGASTPDIEAPDSCLIPEEEALSIARDDENAARPEPRNGSEEKVTPTESPPQTDIVAPRSTERSFFDGFPTFLKRAGVIAVFSILGIIVDVVTRSQFGPRSQFWFLVMSTLGSSLAFTFIAQPGPSTAKSSPDIPDILPDESNLGNGPPDRTGERPAEEEDAQTSISQDTRVDAATNNGATSSDETPSSSDNPADTAPATVVTNGDVFFLRLLRFYPIAVLVAFPVAWLNCNWRGWGFALPLKASLGDAMGYALVYYVPFALCALVIGAMRRKEQGVWPDWRFTIAPALVWLVLNIPMHMMLQAGQQAQKLASLNEQSQQMEQQRKKEDHERKDLGIGSLVEGLNRVTIADRMKPIIESDVARGRAEIEMRQLHNSIGDILITGVTAGEPNKAPFGGGGESVFEKVQREQMAKAQAESITKEPAQAEMPKTDHKQQALGELAKEQAPPVKASIAQDLAKTFGFCYGQHLSITQLRQMYPELESQALLAEMQWNSAFKEAEEGVEARLRALAPDQWEASRARMVAQFESILKQQNSKATREIAINFLEAVQQRAKGVLDSPSREMLLASNPKFVKSPELEFATGYTGTFSSKGHPKANGVELTIRYPLSWQKLEADRPNIVQKWTSDGGHGTDMFMVQVQKLPAPLTPQETEEFFNESSMKEMFEGVGKVLSYTTGRLERLPLGIIHFTQTAKRLDASINARGVSYFLVYEDALISLQFMCYTPGGAEVKEARIKQLEPLIKSIVNSLVLPTRWNSKQTAASSEKSVEEQYQKARRLFQGDGVPKDVAGAERIYRQLAEQGYALAQHDLGVMYGKGEGVPKDAAKAVEWYRKAADQGLAVAQHNLGVRYSRGDGVPQDAAKAVEWLTKAADQGYARAQFGLGMMYYLGDVVAKDAAKAVQWYGKAAEQGHPIAQYFLGEMYENGNGIPKDLAKAVEWYRKAAEQGNSSAQGSLGACYMLGEGVPKDVVQAHFWISLAATGGVTMEQCAVESARLEKRMTPSQIEESKRLVREFKPRKASTATQPPAPILNDSESPQGSGLPRVFVPTPAPHSPTQATGFLISASGHILTAAHVIAGARSVSASTSGCSPVVATLVSIDKANDLALLKVGSLPANAKPLPLAAASERTGAAVFTLGFPNTSIQGREPKLTDGRISSTSGIQDDPRIYQISVPVQPGNSGGPLLNLNGEVVGVVVSRLSAAKMLKMGADEPQNVNYAMKISVARPLIKGVPLVGGPISTARDLPALVEKARCSVVLITTE